MPLDEIPLVVSTGADDTEAISSTKGPYLRNALVKAAPGGDRVYITQRPPLNIISEQDTNITIGRGVGYWPAVATDSANGLYYASNNDIYRGSLTTGSIIGTNTLDSATSKQRVYFIPCDDKLVIIDPEANKGYYIDESAPTVITQITNAFFPGQSSRSTVQLSGGGAYLDGYLFLLGTDGIIYNSNLNDVLTWSSGDQIATDLAQDAGVYLAQHHDNLVAISTGSCQVFYNAGNVNGSPLLPRKDMFFSVGAIDHNAVAVDGDLVYFAGSRGSESGQLYVMERYNVTEIADDTLAEKLMVAFQDPTALVYVAATKYTDSPLCFVTFTIDDSTVTPTDTTMVVDLGSRRVYNYDSEVGSFTGFSVVGVSTRGGLTEVKPRLLMSSSDVGVLDVKSTAEDQISSGDGVYVSTVYEAGIYEAASPSSSEAIRFQLDTMPYDGQSAYVKFMKWLKLLGTTDSTAPTEGTSEINISYSDDNYRTFSTPRAYSTKNTSKLSRLGKFVRRAFRLEYSGTEKLRLEKMQAEINPGTTNV